MNKIKKLADKNIFLNRIIYVCFRVFGLLFSLLCVVMRIVPMKKNKIVGCNMKGKRYGDNPKYIMDAMIKMRPDYEYVWLMNDVTNNSEIPSNVRIAPNSLFSQIYELVTARVWLDSNAKQYGFKKRKNQLYVQTWHGSYGLKKIGRDLKNQSLFDRDNMEYNFSYADLTVSNSKRTSEIFHQAFGYEGKILEYGSPRNDIFWENREEILKKVEDTFNISGKKILLYAPTFRNSFGVDAFNINYEDLIVALEEKFGGEWVVFVRLHPNNISEASKYINYSEKVINATYYSVMQELLVAADILITDYSSCMFDFVTTGKTCFLYATDIDEYKNERDYYFNLKDLPFPLSTNNTELKASILNFDEQKYSKDLSGLFEKVGLCETGKASEKVAEYIIDWMESN